MQIKDLQSEIASWSTENFPRAPNHLALIKIQEELGELASHFIGRLEHRVGKVRTDHQVGIEDAVADVLIALTVFCVRENLDLDLLTQKAWVEVSKRKFVMTENKG